MSSSSSSSSSSPSSSSPSLSLLSLWRRYLSLLKSNPVATKSLTSAVLSALSDFLAQRLSGRPLQFSSIRNQFLIGLLFRGPIVHWWYKTMEKTLQNANITEKNTSPTVMAVMKVGMDQLIFSPFFNLFYFYLIGIVEGKSLSTVNQQVSTDYLPVMKANYKVWPAVNLINFKFMPTDLQVLFGNIVAVFWTVYVISITTKK